MSTVYFCSQTNSTHFTTCCDVAICDDQAKCPVCKVDVTPRSSRGRDEVAMEKLYGRERLAEMRRESDEAWARGSRR